MALDVPPTVQQSAAIPWRVVEGRVLVLLITSARSGRWGIPKGHLEPFLAAHESAAAEAFEEAGVVGATAAEAVGTYRYQKRGVDFSVAVFPLEVREELPRWPDMEKRERRWFSLERAAERVEIPELARMIRRLPLLVHPTTTP